MDRDPCSAVFRALNADRSTVQVDDPPHGHEPHPRPGRVSNRIPTAIVAVQDAREIGVRDPDSAIPHAQYGQRALRGAAPSYRYRIVVPLGLYFTAFDNRLTTTRSIRIGSHAPTSAPAVAPTRMRCVGASGS